MLQLTEQINNFLLEMQGVNYNNYPLVRMDETSVQRLLGKHYQAGFIIISACRGDWDTTNPQNNAAINNQKTKQLQNQIRATKYSYIPVYGGFIENIGTPQEKQVYEASFIVLNYDREGNVLDFSTLKDLGLAWAKEYNQDSIMVKAPNSNPQYITAGGDVDMEFTGDVKVNDLTQQYFTDFIKAQALRDKSKEHRLSFTSECFVNPAPACYTERHKRWLKNEVFLSYQPTVAEGVTDLLTRIDEVRKK